MKIPSNLESAFESAYSESRLIEKFMVTEFKYPEEKQILIHYAKFFNDSITLSIIEKGQISSPSEATHLANFFWCMVDQTVLDTKDSKTVSGQTNLGEWCEDIMQTLRYYFIASGFLNEWDSESDKH